jgi:hypothetical protein
MVLIEMTAKLRETQYRELCHAGKHYRSFCFIDFRWDATHSTYTSLSQYKSDIRALTVTFSQDLPSKFNTNSIAVAM